MRIGMVAWSFYPRVGGSVTTVIQLAQALVNKGIAVDIIAPILNKDLNKINDLAIDKRIKIHWVVSAGVKNYDSFLSRFIFLLKMINKIRRLSAGVAIFHAHDFNLSLLAAIMGTGKPVVAIFGADPLFEIVNYGRKKSVDYERLLKNKAVIVFQKLMRVFIFCVARNRLMVVGCNECSNEIIKKYYSGRQINIPVGIDLDLYKRNQLKEESNEDIILFVGRLVCWKGLDLAVDIFKQARKYHQALKLICIGQGPLKEYYLKKYKDSGIVFIPNLDYQGVIEYYHRAKILLVTSQYETFGINISEAMAAGLPIVATGLDVFADRLIDGANCYLARDRKMNAYLGRTLDLLNNPDKSKEFALKSLAVVENYNINKISDKYVELYKSLI